MTQTILLETLKDFSNEVLKDIILPVKVQKDGSQPAPRCMNVYLMRVPDSNAAKELAPYTIHQAITSKHEQPQGDRVSTSVVVRSIFSVYDPDEQEGALALLNVMERLRINLLKTVVIGRQFTLDLEVGIETLIYPNDTAPYYAGEMITSWKLPRVEREVHP
ncbi:hypothetical protein RFF05_06785 [Bengtsoniella intestinalis]|uniref:hypothetical protein n=1 Tax=Bengtsoniella intestinalis TaxID=3073143 RepID=UPI00391F2029